MAENTQLMFSGMQADAALIVPGNFANRLFERKKFISNISSCKFCKRPGFCILKGRFDRELLLPVTKTFMESVRM